MKFFFAGIFTGDNTGFKFKLPVSYRLYDIARRSAKLSHYVSRDLWMILHYHAKYGRTLGHAAINF
jgi:hypothetical protein